MKKNMSTTIKNMIRYIDNQEVRKEVIKNISKISLVSDKEDLKNLLIELSKYQDGRDILKKKWKIIYNNSQDSVDLLEIFSSNEEIRKEILANIPFLTLKCGVYNKSKLCVKLSKIEGGNQAIAEHFEELFKFCYIDLESVVIPLTKTECGRKKLKEKFEFIKKNFFLNEMLFSGYNPSGFFSLIKSLKDLPEFEKEYEDYSFWAELYDQIQLDSSNVKLPESSIDRENYEKQFKTSKDREFTYIVFSKDREEKKLILQDVANGNKYEYAGVGSSSFVIKAGNKIVKLGIGRRKFEVPYHPRLLMPYFRKEYEDRSILEVYDYTNVSTGDITDEKLLEIYEELEEDGIIWSDARKENLGILLEDNKLPNFIRSEEFNLFGFLKDDRYLTNNHKILKKGDCVICDLDLLYVKDDSNCSEGLEHTIIDYMESKKDSDKDR